MRTRMNDGRDSYGVVSVALHWIVAVLVLLLLASALVMAAYLPDRAAPPLRLFGLTVDRIGIVLMHEALGLVLLPFALARAVWRGRSGKPAAPPAGPLQSGVAAAVWRVLLVGTVAQVLIGPASVILYGMPLQIFDLTVLAMPGAANPSAQAVAEQLHHLVGWTMLGVIALHIAGAFYHHLIARDPTLVRMIRPGTPLDDQPPVAVEPGYEPAAMRRN